MPVRRDADVLQVEEDPASAKTDNWTYIQTQPAQRRWCRGVYHITQQPSGPITPLASIAQPAQIPKHKQSTIHFPRSTATAVQTATDPLNQQLTLQVKGDFPDYCVIAGVPARIVKRLDPPSGKVDLSQYRS
jgi:hypothetical protein